MSASCSYAVSVLPSAPKKYRSNRGKRLNRRGPALGLISSCNRGLRVANRPIYTYHLCVSQAFEAPFIRPSKTMRFVEVLIGKNMRNFS